MEIEYNGPAILKIVEQCCMNDPKAQMQLYRIFSHAMFNASLRIVGDRLLAEDVMQESFLTAFDKIKECKTPAHFGSWLKRIVINRSIDEIRKKKMSFAPLDDHLLAADESVELLSEDEIERSKLLEYVKKGIKILPAGYRIVLTLKLIENFEYSEIAEKLSLKESTVRSQYVRGRQKLLEIVEDLKKKKNDKY